MGFCCVDLHQGHQKKSPRPVTWGDAPPAGLEPATLRIADQPKCNIAPDRLESIEIGSTCVFVMNLADAHRALSSGIEPNRSRLWWVYDGLETIITARHMINAGVAQ